jgi:putative ABC transport system permease protein
MSGPTLLGMRPSALLQLYLWRLHRHKVQELLAALGIAFGVALFFGVLVANTSITATARQIVTGVTGTARFEVTARSAAGMDERMASEIGRLHGIRIASPVLREDASVVGPRGRQLVQLLGVTPSLAALHTSAVRNLGAGATLLSGGLGLPSSVASVVGAEGSQRVEVLSGGDGHGALVRVVLSSALVGPLADSPVAVALLPLAQRLTGLAHRVTEILVEPAPGEEQVVERELRRFAAGRLDVAPADHELQLLKEASSPTRQSTALFAAISAMVGFLLALNAMLLTVPERRRFVAELRTQGFGPRQVLLILASQAAILGLVASGAGIALGIMLSRELFDTVPSYLTFAFPLGSTQEIHAGTVLLALGCGLLAALLASLPPTFDLRRGRRVDAVLHEAGEAGQGISRPAIAALAGAGGLVIVVATTITALIPSLTVVAGVLLALAAVLLIPAAFAATGALVAPVSQRIHGSMLALAVVELRATATRSIALAGVAAIAVYGNVAIQGARSDLTRGLDSAVSDYLASADIWVTTGANVFTTDSFSDDGALATIGRVPGVASVSVYQGGLLDVGSRRLWIRARPPTDRAMLQPSQILHGDLAHASGLLRGRGWAAISEGFAREKHVGVGNIFLLPTPAGIKSFRVAAITTNAGWPPGAVTLSTLDYTPDWQTRQIAALEVGLDPGVSAAREVGAVRAAISSRAGLTAQTRAGREAQFKGNARQALRTLGQIAILLLVVAALAIAFALIAAIWQRRTRLASLKSQGFDSRQLWRALLLETALMLGIGCLDGAILGVFGHALASRWLRMTTGFPAPFGFGSVEIVLTLALVAGVAVAVVAVPGFLAARVSPQASFQD